MGSVDAEKICEDRARGGLLQTSICLKIVFSYTISGLQRHFTHRCVVTRHWDYICSTSVSLPRVKDEIDSDTDAVHFTEAARILPPSLMSADTDKTASLRDCLLCTDTYRTVFWQLYGKCTIWRVINSFTKL